MNLEKELLRDEPRGGFVSEAVCPWCGAAGSCNVPSTPEQKISEGFDYNYELGVYSTNKCMSCRETFFVHRYSDGSWVVRRCDEAKRRI